MIASPPEACSQPRVHLWWGPTVTPPLESAPLLCPQEGSWSTHNVLPVKSCRGPCAI